MPRDPRFRRDMDKIFGEWAPFVWLLFILVICPLFGVGVALLSQQ